MKKVHLLPVLLFIFFILSPVASALFTSSYRLEGTLGQDTGVFFVGKTTIDGNCSGFPMKSYLDSVLVQEMRGFPLIGATSITDLDSVVVAENIDITAASSLEDLIVLYYDHLTEYTNVDIITQKGLFLLGINNGSVNISSNFAFAVTTFVSLDLVSETPTRFLIAGATSPLHMVGSGDFMVLTAISNTSSIQVKDRNGRIRWTGGSANDYILIPGTSFSVTQQPPLFLIPLLNSTQSAALSLSISPAEINNIKMIQLLENVTTSIETDLNNHAVSDFLDNLNQLDLFVRTASFVANGAVVFFQTDDTLNIDQSPQRFSSVGFVRVSNLTITDVESSEGPTLQGNCTLTFLGDHFYTSQTKESANGTRFPYELLLIWICAIGVFVYVRFLRRPPIDRQRDERIKRYAVFIHIIVLVIAFLLLDYEVHSLFGASALSLLFIEGFTMIAGVFFMMEVLIWIFGFFILAIPLQLLSYSVLRLLGVGKGGNGVWKAVGDLSIWIFCGLYLLLFLNIIFSFFDLKSVFPLG